MAQLFIEMLYHYREESGFRLHEFTVMYQHVHLMLTTTTALDVSGAMQRIKGGFAYEARKRFQIRAWIWQRGFSEHCIRDQADYEAHQRYIWQNAVKKHLALKPEEYPYCSANPIYKLDPMPDRFGG